MLAPPLLALWIRTGKGQFALAGKLPTKELVIVAPFIKLPALRRLTVNKTAIRVLTRYSLHDFQEGVSDLAALRHLLDIGAEVRGIRNLHAKMYLFGSLRAIVTSANLTDAALNRNHELGFVAGEAGILKSCAKYFEHLWTHPAVQKTALTAKHLDKWEAEIAPFATTKGKFCPGLRDYGADLGLMPDPPAPSLQPGITTQAYVKFFGTGEKGGRADRNARIIDEVAGSDGHWAMAYPNTKRPREVRSGDVMFISHLVKSPDDTLIYGRAIASAHQPGRDDASATDIVRISWKDTWGTYIRVHDPEFIAGTISNGISLRSLMDEFGAETFLSTDANRRKKSGNTDPRLALRRRPHMSLTQKAADWLNARFYQALAQHGRIPVVELEKLYWPK